MESTHSPQFYFVRFHIFFQLPICLTRCQWLFLCHFYHFTLNIPLNCRKRVWQRSFSVYSFKLFRSKFKTFLLLLFFFVLDEVFELSKSKSFLIKIIIKLQIIWKLFVMRNVLCVFMHANYVIIFRSFHHHSWFADWWDGSGSENAWVWLK